MTFPLPQIDDDLTARVSMADAKFSFQERGKIYSPQWFSPEGNVRGGRKRKEWWWVHLSGDCLL